MWMITQPLRLLLDILFPPKCLGCGRVSSPVCKQCLHAARKAIQTPYPFIVSAYSFKDPLIRRAIHSMKYFHRKDIASSLGEDIGQLLLENGLRGILVPLPMHPLRKMVRGYNHAEELAKKAAATSGLTLRSDILERKTLTRRQVKTRTRGERRRNQYGAFCAASDVAGADIILIDDVTTTGATLLEARTTLLSAGASRVYAVTVAH